MILRIFSSLLFLLLFTGCTLDSLDSGQNSLPDSSEESLVAFVAIHLEPGIEVGEEESLLYQERYWPALVELVDLADKYDVKLTLEFNPQWGTYILEDSEKLALLHSWEKNGHEIAVHHHGPHHGGGWNGYTNQEEYVSDPRYFGTIEDMMSILNQLPANGDISTGGISADEDKDPDWPNGIIYSTDGGINREEDLLSTPTLLGYGDGKVLHLTHAQYATGKMALSLNEIQQGIDSADEGEVLGIVFHERNYEENPEDVELLFQLFEENNISVLTVSEILG